MGSIERDGKAGGRTFDTQGYDDLGNYILDISKELNSINFVNMEELQ